MKKKFTVAAVVAVVALSIVGYGALPNREEQSNSANSTQVSMAGDAMHGQMATTEMMSATMASETMTGAMNESPAMESQAMGGAGKMVNETSTSMEGQSMSSMMAGDSPTMTAHISNGMAMTPAMAQ